MHKNDHHHEDVKDGIIDSVGITSLDVDMGLLYILLRVKDK